MRIASIVRISMRGMQGKPTVDRNFFLRSLNAIFRRLEDISASTLANLANACALGT